MINYVNFVDILLNAPQNGTNIHAHEVESVGSRKNKKKGGRINESFSYNPDQC